QPLANRLAMATHDIFLAFEALLLQPGVQVIETVEPGCGDEEIPATIANAIRSESSHALPIIEGVHHQRNGEGNVNPE
ncbi:MAG: hypothetical protein ACR2RA_24095, partial [Geminicoccaceae bacterium]